VIVASDASPVIALSAVGNLELLHKLYGAVLLPRAVFKEVASGGPSAPGAAEVHSSRWFRAIDVKDRSLVQALSLELDLGEAEAIALAVENKADLLLMDERRGRAAARSLGCRVMGVLGVLIEAKARGELTAVKPILNSLRTDAGFRIDEALYARALQAARES
jgi:predicted nucleic acid-binding protein